MRAIDTHAHLDLTPFEPDRAELIQGLNQQQIGVINPSTDVESIVKVDRLSRDNPLVWGAIGLHPNEVNEEVLTQLPTMIDQWRELIARNGKLIAIGEIGLDYYRGANNAAAQKAALRTMLGFALEQKRPVIFHCRDAYGDLLTILDDHPDLTGAIHCFSGSKEQAQAFLERGLLLSFTAMVTYPGNDNLRQILTELPLERIMLETDSPFLSPQERRGERNDPRNIIQVAEVIATAQSISLETVLEQTTKNAQQLFRI